MEPRAIAAHLDRDAARLTVWRSTQSPFGTRAALSAVLGRPEHTIRVIAPDVGGAFGAKSNLYPDELATVLLAMDVDRPVRWVSTRGEDLLFTLQGRDQVNLVDATYTSAGEITGLEVRCVHNLGGGQRGAGCAGAAGVRSTQDGAGYADDAGEGVAPPSTNPRSPTTAANRTIRAS
jgi:carbon-monoxide dehydrogenase large subunit